MSNTTNATRSQDGLMVSSRTQTLVGTAVLAALIVVLQVSIGSIQVGAFTFTFSLVPIVIGAALYGIGAGTILGTVFGLVVTMQVISGAAGAFSTMMLTQNPIATIVVCILKGALAGLVAGAVAKAIMPKNLTAGVIVAAILTPLTNTGIFSIAMLTIFQNLLSEVAAGQGLIVTLILGFIGVNFLVEEVINIVLAPVVVNIIRIVKKNKL